MLELRVMCQELLDANGLKPCFVGTSGGTLCIFSPCGKPIMHVNGLEMPRKKLCKEERVIVHSLFEKFLETNGSLIVEKFSILKELSEMPMCLDMELPEGVSLAYPSGKTYAPTLNIHKNGVNISASISGNISSIHNNKGVVADTIIEALAFAKEHIAHFVSAQSAFYDKRDALNKRLQELSSCKY